jgi:hypothetical protein
MKDYITRDDNLILSGIPYAVCFALLSVSHEDARATFRSQFSSGVLFSIYVSRTTEDAKVR